MLTTLYLTADRLIFHKKPPFSISDYRLCRRAKTIRHNFCYFENVIQEGLCKYQKQMV